jgi:5'-3' exonuclease
MNIPEPTVALMDIDQICYAVASMAEGKDMPDSHICQAAKQMVEKRKKEVLELYPAVRTFKFFISHTKNFRKEIDTDVAYKGNRPPKPKALSLVREYFQNKYDAQMLPYLEADDHTAMNHWASYYDGSYKTVLVDQDKDLDQVPGHRVIPGLTRTVFKVRMPGEKPANFNGFAKAVDYLGDQEGDIIESKVVVRKPAKRFITIGEANLSFYRQLLTGDGCDDIPGIKGMGAKTAAKVLPNEECENTLYAKVLDTYLDYYQDDCYSEIMRMIFERAQLLYMRRFPNDLWLPPKQEKPEPMSNAY